MNNMWKILGGVGASALLLPKLINLFQNVSSGSIRWWGPTDYLWTFLPIMGFGLIAVAFFMANTDSSSQVTEAPKPQQVEPSTPDFQVPSIGNWIGWFLILAIPLVGFVFMIIWAVDKSNPVRRNFILASLILYGIVIALYILMMLFFIAAVGL
tara:strand:+ start:343 stop:804 length:462 start_codon:yes stop_codon:yes gene_type:complete